MERDRSGQDDDEKVDEMGDESFPASDPPSTTPVTGVAQTPKEPEWPEGRAHEETPKQTAEE